MRRIPFEIDRAQRGTLAEQMADGLRRAIRSGIYRKGDRLPAVRELVARFGVSSRVPVAAFKILVEEGLVDAVPHRGCVVRALRSPVWKGHICIATSADFSYNTMMLANHIRSALSRARYLFTQVTVPRMANGRLDMGLIDYVLQQPVDFAVVLDCSRSLAMRFENAGVPFVAQATDYSGELKMCRSVYECEMGAVFRRFAACCRTRGDRRALCVVKRPGESADLAKALEKAGVTAEEWCLYPRRQSRGRLETLRRTAFNAFETRLVKGCKWMPDVICFNDDYVATGAMAALLAHGICFPQDVHIATVVNIGNAPVFADWLDRFEVDLEESGEMISQAVLARLAGKRIPFRLKLPVRFVPSAKPVPQSVGWQGRHPGVVRPIPDQPVPMAKG